MDKKRGNKKTLVKIISFSNSLNKKNIIFRLIFILLLVMILYFAIKTWPIMKERLSDEDEDGVKNYQDKCINTPKSISVDSYGCEIIKETAHKESPSPIEEYGESINAVCSEDDGGYNIWKKGTCDDGNKQTDYCDINFVKKLYEYECINNICTKESVDCSDYNALCYDGICIDKNKDSDKDGYPDLDEYKEDTDPNNPLDYPANITSDNIIPQNDCNSRCIILSYVSGRGPFDSMGYCNYPEVGNYLSGNSGDICCCMPLSTGYYSFQQCISLQNSHGADFSWRQEADWTQLTCQAYAAPRCDATNIGFDRNCCWWSCKKEVTLTDEQKCQQWMTSGGYNYWILGISSSEACYNKAVQDCSNRGQQYSLSVYQDPTMGCCNWKCKEIPPPQCYDSDANVPGLESLKTKAYCTLDGGITKKWDYCKDGKLVEYACSFDKTKCEEFTHDCSYYFNNGACSDGACIIQPFCIVLDGAGLDLWTGGYCEDAQGKHEEICIDSNTLREWECNNNQCSYTDYACFLYRSGSGQAYHCFEETNGAVCKCC